MVLMDLDKGEEKLNGTSKSDVLLFAAVPKVLNAKISEPIASPKFVLAVAADAAPVPPCAISILVALHVPVKIVPNDVRSVAINLEAGMLPANFILVILASAKSAVAIVPSKIFEEVIALAVIKGKSGVFDKSPFSLISP